MWSVDDRFRVVDSTRGTVLAERARRTSSAWERFRGLMLSPGLPEGEALVIEPCNSIHMFFMRYPIDVVFASRELEVVGLVEGIRPWRMTRLYRGARAAIELPAGTIARCETERGDHLAFEPVGRA